MFATNPPGYPSMLALFPFSCLQYQGQFDTSTWRVAKTKVHADDPHHQETRLQFFKDLCHFIFDGRAQSTAAEIRLLDVVQERLDAAVPPQPVDASLLECVYVGNGWSVLMFGFGCGSCGLDCCAHAPFSPPPPPFFFLHCSYLLRPEHTSRRDLHNTRVVKVPNFWLAGVVTVLL